MSLIDQAGAARIEEAVHRIEQKSAAEIVVAVVPRSAEYWTWRAVLAGSWAVATAILFHRLVPWGGEIVAFLVQVPVAFAVWLLFGIPRLHRLLVAERDAEEAVRAMAFRLFAERGVHRTRDATGMLLVVSELEHRVVLLGDRGIHERVGDGGWRHHVDHLVGRIREGRTTDGVLEVLAELEPLLGERVPQAAADTNELPNTVVRGT